MKIYKVDNRYYKDYKLMQSDAIKNKAGFFQEYDFNGTVDGTGPFKREELHGELENENQLVLSVSEDDGSVVCFRVIKKKNNR